MVGIVMRHLQRRTSRQQSHPNLSSSTDVRGEGHRLTIGRKRRKFFHPHKVGKPPQLYWERILSPRPQPMRRPEAKADHCKYYERNRSRCLPTSALFCRKRHCRAASTFLAAYQLQIEGQVARRLKPFGRVLLQAAMHDASQRRRKIARRTRKRGRLLLENCTHSIG